MNELSPESRSNATEYTVSEISGALRRTVEDAFGNVRVRGEISGYRGPHSSGHAYFCLKDDRARLEAVVWKTTMARLKFRPEEGMEVIASGKLTTYAGKSNYQIVIDNLEPAGAGALMALLEERKRRLAAEGLFEAARKRPLPFMPMVIGVATSPTGAVIRDIVHRIKDRFPVHVLVWPVRVQGETSGPEVTAAVAGFNALPQGGAVPRPDVIIVARGGGSLEDLWGFNDEALARAVAASQIPVISAVGHETDWTLVDLAADRRAPTPTGAAEMAVPVRDEIAAKLASLAHRLRACTARVAEKKRTALRAASRSLPAADQILAMPRRRFDEATGRLGRALSVGTQRRRARLDAIRLTPAALDRQIGEGRRAVARILARAELALAGHLRDWRRHLERTAARAGPGSLERSARQAGERLAALSRRADQATAALLTRQRARLTQADRLLSTLSHKAVLARGFALVTDTDGTLVKSARAVHPGAALTLSFADGTADAVATASHAEDAGEPPARPAAAAKPRPRTAPRSAPAGTQGSLF